MTTKIHAEDLYTSDASTPGTSKYYGNNKWETVSGGGETLPGFTRVAPVFADWNSVNMPSVNRVGTWGSNSAGIWIRNDIVFSNPLEFSVISTPEPTIPYVVDIGYMFTSTSTPNGNLCGVGWINPSTTTAFMMLEAQEGGPGRLYGYVTTNYAGTSPPFASFQNYTFPQLRFVRLSNDGTTMKYMVSKDGINYTNFTYGSQTVGTYLTPTDLTIFVGASDEQCIGTIFHYYIHP